MDYPELEAHRVWFEQQYTERYGVELLVKRTEVSYSIPCAAIAWQAHQWALADADRAQRAAPVSVAPMADTAQVVIPKKHKESAAYMASLNKYLPIIGALSEIENISTIRACSGPHCMYVAGVEGARHSRECLIQAGLDQGWTPTDEELANTGPSSATVQPVEAAHCAHEFIDARNQVITSGEVCIKCGALRPGNSAQPVEVQPVAWEQFLRDFTRHASEAGDHTPDSFQRGIVALANRAHKLLAAQQLVEAQPVARYSLEVNTSEDIIEAPDADGEWVKFSDLAQPVAREPLTTKKLLKIAGNSFMASNNLSQMQIILFVRDIEAYHGIKPTGTEGGAG